MHCTIEINIDNQAFEDTEELPRILKDLSNTINVCASHVRLKDINGNTIGYCHIE